MSRSSVLTSDSSKVVLFPEGPGYVFISLLANTNLSRVMVVRSLQDGQLYARKETLPNVFEEGNDIQSPDVKNMLHLRNIEGVPKLFGWTEYQDEVNSNNFITSSYWELCEGGTLDQMERSSSVNCRSLPENCLWSIYAQLLALMIRTIEASVLHIDAHGSNWYLQCLVGDALPQVMLGDWGMAELKPTEHNAGCVHTRCQNGCQLRDWWDSCSAIIKFFIVGLVINLATLTEQYKTGRKPSKVAIEYLQLLLDIIENHPPSQYRTGDEWFEMIKRLSAFITQHANDREQNANTNSGATEGSSKVKSRSKSTKKHKNSCQNLTTSRHPPPFNETLDIMHSLDDYRETGNPTPQFWRIAHVNLISGAIVALEGEHERNGYEDHTCQKALPEGWAKSHKRTVETVAALDRKKLGR